MIQPKTWGAVCLGKALQASAAVPLTLAAWILRSWLLGGAGRDLPYLLFYPAVVIASIWMGLAAGLFGTLLAALLVFFRIQGGRETFLEAAALGVFVASCLMICLLLESRRRARLGRRKDAEALAKGERRWQTMVNALQEGFSLRQIITDGAGVPVDYRFLAVNPAYAALMGRSQEALVGRRMSEFKPELAPFWVECLGKVALGGGAARVAHFEEALGRWYQIHAFSPEPGQVAVLSLDITDQKRVEEERFRAIVEQSPVGFGWHDRNGRILEVNPAFQAMLGYGKEEMMGLSFTCYLHPEEVERSLELRRAMLRGETPEITRECRWIRKDGATILVQLTLRPLHDAAGAIESTFITVEDITERRRVEEALRASEELYSAIFRILPAGLVITDEAGQYVELNPAAERILGITRKEGLGRIYNGPEWNKIHPDGSSLEPRESPANRVLRTGVAVEAMEMGVHRPDGSLVWILNSVTPIPVKGCGVAGVFVDITARREAEAALAAERMRYKSIMDIAQDAIYIVDEDGLLLECNEAFLSARGYTAEEARTLRIQDWNAMGYPEELKGRIQALIEQPGGVDRQHRRKDGSVFEVEINAGRIDLDGKPHLLASARDITARKALERERGLRHAELEALNRSLEARVTDDVREIRSRDKMLATQSRLAAMGEMIGHIAHQWRQPLNALSMLLANLEDAQRFGELDGATLEKSLEKGNLLIQKMSSTISDFGNFFKPEKAWTRFSALEQARAAVALVEASFQACDIEIRIDALADLTLCGYPNEYSQVLLNLLTNAKQAIQETYATSGLVTIGLRKEDGFGCLTVGDNGGGIPDAILDRIFEPYFSTRHSGTGIGLAMSRQIIEESMFGHITARNLDGGAEFGVYVVLG